MTKQFDETALLSELSSSAFFRKQTERSLDRPENPTPTLSTESSPELAVEGDGNQQGLGPPAQGTTTPQAHDIVKPRDHARTTPRDRDTTRRRTGDTATPRAHNTMPARTWETAQRIEEVRRAVKQFGKDEATYRFTSEERRGMASVVYAYSTAGIRTSQSQIARIALNWLLADYRESGESSVLARVLARLND